jgi:uncharacterized protein with FMN-binding domain
LKRIVSITVTAAILLTTALTAAAEPAAAKLPIVDAYASASTKAEEKATAPAKQATPPSKKETKPAAPAKQEQTTVKQEQPSIKQPAPEAAAKPASAPQNPYQDGVYVAYGNAYSKGTEGVKVTIKDGKAVQLELLRTSPKLIDRDVRFNYSGLWQAYETMKGRLLGKTRQEAAQADAVSGATRSSEGWKLALDRAFVSALKVKPADQVYFEGEHMGVDPEGKYMAFAKYDQWKLVGVKLYPLNAKGDAIDEASMTAEQAKLVYTIANEMLYRGMKAQAVKGYERDYEAALNALWDADQNARVVKESLYVDGFYSAYGEARDKGVERADIVIRNGKLVDVRLYRLGANLIDRGDTAYADVVAANAPMTAKLLANGSYIQNYEDKTDAITGATESSHSWNLAVERAFQKALAKRTGVPYFEGTFAGVDHQSKLLILVDMASDQATAAKVHLFGADKKLIKEEALTAGQKALVSQLEDGLAKKGKFMPDIKGEEAMSAAARAAFVDALLNASTKQTSQYKDGTFIAYGDAYDKGANRADVTLRNGKIVDVKLARVGVNMVDRGATAYPEVVKAIPILTAEFWAAGTKAGVQQVDAVSGATSSSEALKAAVDRAYKKAEIVESYKTAYLNGVHPGVDAEQSVYVLATVERNVPVKMELFFLDENGKVKAAEALSPDEQAVKAEIETPAAAGAMHKYAYRPAAFGESESVLMLSAKAINAIKSALEAAGR